MNDVHGISKGVFDFIVQKEVSSKAYYDKALQRPTWPKEASGITVAIGYDVGWATKEKLWADWSNRISDAMITVLERACGVRGAPARDLLPSIKPYVAVPWDAAIAVFTDRDVPKWVETVRRALPNCDRLTPDSFGALVSLAYNRGQEFTSDPAHDHEGRYREMRNIREHMESGQFDRVPGEFRAMKRLWPNSAGLRDRREQEAKIFENGLGL